MRVTLAQEHIDHFNKTGSIEFDGVFTPEEREKLLTSLEQYLKKRMRASEKKPLDFSSNESLFLNGRNLWRDGLEIKKLCSKKQFGEIAYHLFRKKPLKLAYDQYVRTSTLQDCPFAANATLQEISSIRPLLGAVIIMLSPDESPATEEVLIPKKAGNALFISGNLTLPLTTFFNQKTLSMLVIAFTTGKAIYCLETKDPHTHSFKKEGVVFGDAAGEDLCPTLYHP